MSAARSRAELSAIGCDIVAHAGDPGERRAAQLLGRLTGTAPATATTLDDLLAAPGWLREPPAAQRRVALAAALLAMGRTLTTAIDGRWLGALAEVTGEELLDWAIQQAGDMPSDGSRLAAETLEPTGFALMRRHLPPGLRSYLAWAPVREPTPSMHDERLGLIVALAAEAPR